MFHASCRYQRIHDTKEKAFENQIQGTQGKRPGLPRPPPSIVVGIDRAETGGRPEEDISYKNDESMGAFDTD